MSVFLCPDFRLYFILCLYYVIVMYITKKGLDYRTCFCKVLTSLLTISQSE